ncbi:hypothetical protein [Edaphobacter bradus]|uniref:hypothetical protein n=1 Tax=Edaphobacter bradus TaxID=2259016 RepID=UPI0021DFFF78|nr:hypothetical protein [Edaphobacter bradus]
MIPALREEFNRNYTPEKYRHFLDALDKRCGSHVGFRVCETPCFLPKTLLDQMAQYGRELVLQLVDDPQYLRASDASIPPQYKVANESRLPMFLQVDFGLVRSTSGELEPKLVELQAFPSVYGYQPLAAQQYVESYALPEDLGIYLNGFNGESYWKLLRNSIVAEHDAENVILLEIDPIHQKTLPDFLVTQRELGIAVVDILSLIKRGRKLFYRNGGREIEVHRIYNRCIVDELERKSVTLPFDLRDDLDAEWAGHPNWYFRISKFSIPHLRHRSVPRTWFLDEVSKLPEDAENYLLKPLYSFAGLGIKFDPTQADVDAIPHDQRHNYILQERVYFEPVIHTPHGATQMEIRLMYVWPEGGELTPVLPLIRMGRGKMMGVDHNRNLEWVGGSAALWA